MKVEYIPESTKSEKISWELNREALEVRLRYVLTHYGEILY